MTRHVPVAAALAAIALVLVLWLSWPVGEPRVGTRAEPEHRARTVRPITAPAVAPSPPEADPEEAAVAREWRARVADVGESCDLPVDARCEGGACVALLHGPDLDGALGWLGLALTSPRFVASTVLRDLGVDAQALPCGSAIDALVAGRGVPMIELPDGTEVWCATDEGLDTALCDRLARERFGAEGFGRRGVRMLSY